MKTFNCFTVVHVLMVFVIVLKSLVVTIYCLSVVHALMVFVIVLVSCGDLLLFFCSSHIDGFCDCFEVSCDGFLQYLSVVHTMPGLPFFVDICSEKVAAWNAKFIMTIFTQK